MNTNQLKVTIDGKDYTNHVPLPIKWEDLLDERLDEARISVKYVRETIFRPLTPVNIEVRDSFGNQIEKNYVVSTSFSNEAPSGSGKYNVELTLVESTKILERFLIDTITFTNDLGRIYTNNPQVVEGVISNQTGTKIPVGQNPYVTPALTGTVLNVKSAQTIFSNLSSGVLQNAGSIVIKRDGQEIDTIGVFETKDITLVSGSYQIIYNVEFYLLTEYAKETVTYDFFAVTNTEPLPLWNIATVIDRLLTIAEPLRLGDMPRFELDPTQRDQLEKIKAPEFAFTANTLKEALDQIGGFIHAVPRLINENQIHFDFLGGIDVAEGVKDYPYCTETFSMNVENFCTKIDSRVDNLVNILDPEQGVITDPLDSGPLPLGRSVRTETVYARLTESDMMIPTFFPIQEIKSVYCGFLPGQKYDGGDITPYVFEEADYIRLSTTKEEYPKSRAYAIYYTQGQKNIKGLGFKIENAISPIFEKYSIVNILRNTSGHPEFDITGTDYPKLYFRISYIPIYSARVEQTKSDISGFNFPSALAYNQAANLIETRYYGENLKGVIARMGNVERSRTFIGQKLSSIPKAGQLFDDQYYISSVAVEVCPFDYKCTLGLSKDFNRLSQYIGINSMKRFYEVSEKQAYRRDFHYTDYMVISDEEQTPEDTLFSKNAMVNFVSEFNRSDIVDRSITLVQATGSDALPSVTLPVVRSGFGNAMVFTFEYEDNYGAGLKSILSTSGNVSGYYMENVAYSDVYGRMENLYVEFDSSVFIPTLDRIGNIPLAIPQYQPFDQRGVGSLTTEDRPFVIKKDSKEALAINYQIEFVTTSSKFVVGSALARNNPLISGLQESRIAKLYILPNRIPKFADVLDLSGATEVRSYGASSDVYLEDGKVKFKPETATANGKSWAFVDSTTNELLFGKNELVQSGQTITFPTMTPKHKIFN